MPIWRAKITTRGDAALGYWIALSAADWLVFEIGVCEIAKVTKKLEFRGFVRGERKSTPVNLVNLKSRKSRKNWSFAVSRKMLLIWCGGNGIIKA